MYVLLESTHDAAAKYIESTLAYEVRLAIVKVETCFRTLARDSRASIHDRKKAHISKLVRHCLLSIS